MELFGIFPLLSGRELIQFSCYIYKCPVKKTPRPINLTNLDVSSFCRPADHSSVDAQVQAPGAHHPARPSDGPVPDPVPASQRGEHLFLPGDGVHHRHGLPEPTGDASLTPTKTLR